MDDNIVKEEAPSDLDLTPWKKPNGKQVMVNGLPDSVRAAKANGWVKMKVVEDAGGVVGGSAPPEPAQGPATVKDKK